MDLNYLPNDVYVLWLTPEEYDSIKLREGIADMLKIKAMQHVRYSIRPLHKNEDEVLDHVTGVISRNRKHLEARFPNTQFRVMAFNSGGFKLKEWIV